ncbi:hypothetical protein SAMN05519104_8192 [Rhizobiales bacterium GAS188]|nr:hypothetical protein SAMN05519104_4387 [Rhizobiales bacterium GAS188]SEF06341.1 hypothetical protein SAMN05519104_8192 [Rhizobiales bacterium GAS188]
MANKKLKARVKKLAKRVKKLERHQDDLGGKGVSVHARRDRRDREASSQ